MTDSNKPTEFIAIDLSRIRPEELYRRPRPIACWPTVTIRIDDVREKTCIASWRRDVMSSHAVSQRLSECAWDALHLGFSYLLCDLVSLPQDAPDIAPKLIKFNKLYGILHAVVAYDADRDLRRTWIMPEARGIVMSPTALSYILQRWKVSDVPLAASLTIRQICRKRLGIDNLNVARLSLVDTDQVAKVRFLDLALIDNTRISNVYGTINLDRRSQAFASDVLLVYEANGEVPRFGLIAKLAALRSNCLAIPALILIWAMLEGLRVSIRGCDWPAAQILQQMDQILRFACQRSAHEVHLRAEEQYRHIVLEGALERRLVLELKDSPLTHQARSMQDIWAYGQGERTVADGQKITWGLLGTSIDFVQAHLNSGAIAEPLALDTAAGQYTLSFDNDHYDAEGML